MAQKKDTTPEVENQTAPEVEEPQGEKMVRIRLPLTKTEKEDVFVRVNQRTWLIKRGEEVEIPECAAEVLRHSEEQMLESLRYQEKVQRARD